MRFAAASARIGLFSLRDWTQDVVSERSQDYARWEPLSRFCKKFVFGDFNFKNNRLLILSQ
jgi:hypothetical protein